MSTVSYTLEVATSTPRAGRRFEPVQERELHRDALNAVQSLARGRQGVVVVPEFAGPIGIPDFTAYVGDIGRLRRRHDLGVPPVINELDSGIVSATHVARPRTAQGIAKALDWPLDTVSSRIRGLVRRRALNEPSPGRYLRPESLAAGGRLYAVESKVDDWRSALRQVRTYRVWADSYVLIMGQLSERAQGALSAEVRRDRGGLVVSGQWIERPRLGTTAARRRTQAWEYFAAATQEGLRDPAFALPVHS